MSAVPDLERLQKATLAETMGRAEVLDRARVLLSPWMQGRQAPAYPVQALGPLAFACEAIAADGQVQSAMVGQALLGAASLLIQGLYNVETLTGVCPTSLYLMTLGDSGDGKSLAQSTALSPVHHWQRQVAQALKSDEAVQAPSIERGKKTDLSSPRPFRLVGDATAEGLRADLDAGVCSQGIFTDEAAVMVSGYGMSADHRCKTAGMYSKLWDQGHLSVTRVVHGRVERYGVRVAMHWLIQPMAVSEAISDPMLTAMGFWPRFLLAWPVAQYPRLFKPFKPEERPAVQAYWARATELLAIALPEDADKSPLIRLSPDAKALLGVAFERFEIAGRTGDLRAVKPFALRASEQACRIAGVLAGFAGCSEVSGDTMHGALALAMYSVDTWKAVIDDGAADQRGGHALRLYEWLIGKPSWTESLAVIVNAGPSCVRSKDRRNAALEALEAAGLVLVSDGRAQALLPPPTGGSGCP